MGVRGLCNGLGPAAFGLMWHLFGIHIDNIDNGLETINNKTVVSPTESRALILFILAHYAH